MCDRVEILNEIYGQFNEDARLQTTRQGQLEYFTTMTHIHRFASAGAKILEVGAGTGRYSIALAKEGMDVTAVELVESNLAVLKKNGAGIESLKAYQADGTNLQMFLDGTFDVTLVFGPMYHLYDEAEVHAAIDEAVRVTKKGGVLLFAFLSAYAIMFSNYLSGDWAAGQKLNFTDDYRIRHFKEQLFTGYDVVEFERLFETKPVSWITTAGTDGMLELVEARKDFLLSDEDFGAFADWYFHISEKRELLGSASHLLYICRKN